MAPNSQYALPPQSSLQESTGGKSHAVMLKAKLKRAISREFRDYCLVAVLNATRIALRHSEVVRRKAPRHILWWSNLYKLKPQICIVMHVWSLHTCVQIQ